MRNRSLLGITYYRKPCNTLAVAIPVKVVAVRVVTIAITEAVGITVI